MKLHELPRNSRLIVKVQSEGEKFATFHHIDGMYSLCTLDDGRTFHLYCNQEMKQVGEAYKLVAKSP